jgi:hypothetical protein
MFKNNYESLPSFGGKTYNTVVSAAYMDYALNFFLSRGYSIKATAAIMGNAQQETQFNPSIDGDSGKSTNIFQWNMGRRTNLMNYAKKCFPNSDYSKLTDQEKFQAGLGFCHLELHSPEFKNALSVLTNHENDTNLAALFGHIYEGFGDNSGYKRNNYAAVIYDNYNDGKYKKYAIEKPLAFLDIYGIRITPVAYTKEEWFKFVMALDLSKLSWKPEGLCVHNTSAPSLSQWIKYGPTVEKQWPSNLNNFYKSLGWHSSVHIVSCPDYIWNLCNLLQDGVSVSCWNSIMYGLEMVGEYESEEFNSGVGLQVKDNAMFAISTLFHKFKWKPVIDETLRFHRKCIADHHNCPGKNVTDQDVLENVLKVMATFN